ncbi:1-deoxy-D-xylulose-5-phosphate reductoisomerase [Caldanaerobacter subterraneus subsp. tengcongensis MB4]|uniref:1-deoxy-D-xylulose 5-phosphate reductoisomerase n=1 Tax=Caldanaerobacter subterraneus subsp. tengcongensis (strain DSM 15242 / JCM 11007 / NBRC 100824 / MB4) TaxID=273068 RepID=DXR_CALS4|nr:1-deoxy-D-xylulose-5-phosphate reductoisomerase [Caldanaerobacter subterraneus]Q8RA28.1 RecName: Full=1-deoxy-D-xylulose 5-phosphate reductoisomerase; Short=DXP reductoisomerase; AltName: Full=1-deoxyxylulose-5-phosphate reductoisomerase; AltName: Full=2-C-methyl-D-erythritol 4-phosphate synthase [Caldanaerobacter subterraneus subsp. tengcongensis MB4]AAM24624.1 1-deoxy-D-xylulose 5-phosphate reductoisomerase [Caldanaerobacter subterraneus subsp. tengcongensis MB4]MBE3579273.1 1-deoxy-D-xylul
MKKLIILGSTGSIGRQTLDVVRSLKEEFEIVGLTGYNNVSLLSKQIKEFRPKVVAVKDEEKARKLRENLDEPIEVLTGKEGLKEIVKYEADMVVVAVEGIAGLIPTVEAIKLGKNIALANKEVLVTAGEIVMGLVKEKKIEFLPVDSEHSAILQCLKGNNKREVSNLILTASGGPFRGKKKKDLVNVTVEEALKHPNWKMGKKITIDSATLMNKGFEVIEARWLFDMPLDKIKVVIHPQSIIHSMVEYVDGSVIAQLSVPDMRIAIQYALNYPDRKYVEGVKFLDFYALGQLTFEEPDFETFKCLSLAYHAAECGGTMTAVLNAADEVAVSLFLQNKINFLEIAEIIEEALENHKNIQNPTLDDIISVDLETRERIMRKYLR